ncbi:acetyltransferase, partial [Streptomyces varsoviensis]
RLYRKYGYAPVSREEVSRHLTVVTLEKAADADSYVASA